MKELQCRPHAGQAPRRLRAARVLPPPSLSSLWRSLGRFAGCGAGPQASVRPRVVLQMSEADPAKWNLALNNAKNIQTDLGAANVDIELVAYGPGSGC
jgi:hypothetical protein